VYNFYRTQDEIIRDDLKNLIPGRRDIYDIMELFGVPVSSRTGKSTVTTRRFRYTPFWETGLKELSPRERALEELKRKKQEIVPESKWKGF